MNLIYWKIGAGNLASRMRPTLLAVLIGSIAVILMCSGYFVLFSISYSKSLWEAKHFGVIGSEISPRFGRELTGEQIASIRSKLEARGIASLPYLSQIVAVRSGLSTQAREDGILALGFDFGLARAFEPRQPLWQSAPLADEEAIVSAPLARRLGLRAGDTLVVSFAGKDAAVTIRDVAEEQGLTGFRGSVRARGTVILAEQLARELFGATEAGAHGILLATDRMYSSLPGSSFFADFIERPIKKEALSHMSMVESMFTPPFLFFAFVSLFAGLLLLAQLFHILGERRKHDLGVLRSLGVGTRGCFAVFVSECALLSGLVVIAGVIIGHLLGYGLLTVNARYVDQLLERHSAYAYPILPHIDVKGTIGMAVMLYALFLLAALHVGRFIRRTPIPHLLGKEDNRADPARMRWLKIAAGLLVIAAFVYFNYFAEEELSDADRLNAKVIGSIISWFFGVFAAAYLLFLAVPWLSRLSSLVPHRLVNRLAVTLGTRYPHMRFGRSFGIALLLTVLTCSLIIMVSFASNVREYAAAHRKDSFMAADAYMAYTNEREQALIRQHLAEENALVRHAAFIETYRVLVSSSDEKLELKEVEPPTNGNIWAYSQVTWGKWIGDGYELTLTSRAPQFSTDDEVFKALKDQESLVLVDERLEGTWRVGDQVKLRVLKDGGKMENLIGEETVTIAGTFDIGEDNRFGGRLFIVSDTLHDKYGAGGYKWPGDPKGFALLQLAGSGRAADDAIRTLKYRLAETAGVAVRTPGEDQAVITSIVRAEFALFAWIMSFMLLMALLGLYAVQVRSLQERTAHIVMLRQIGIDRRTMRQIFIVEGCVIGLIGLAGGVATGRIGAEMLMRLAWMGVEFSFPWPETAGLAVGLTAFTWLFNRFGTAELHAVRIGRTE